MLSGARGCIRQHVNDSRENVQKIVARLQHALQFPDAHSLTTNDTCMPTHIATLTSFKDAVARVPIQRLNLARS